MSVMKKKSSENEGNNGNQCTEYGILFSYDRRELRISVQALLRTERIWTQASNMAWLPMIHEMVENATREWDSFQNLEILYQMLVS